MIDARAASLALLVLATAALSHAVAAEGEPEFPHGDFEGDCETCHTDEGWTPARVDPAFRAKQHPFPLRQAHDLPDCRACHRSLDFTTADPACVSCHVDPHRSELGTDCSQCHVPRTFIDRRRMQANHQLTRFPLRGSHRALDCEDCHHPDSPGLRQWVGTPVECFACHAAAYQATSDPNHALSGFPTECDLCHAPTVWEAGRFNHALTSEPCVNCHLDDYDRTSDPNHRVAGFPTDCEPCHDTRRWENGRFDHDAMFPIYSGPHRGRWDSCSTCHIDPNSFSVFSCLGCHPHSDETETRNHHSGVSGFEYLSTACYACHPRGRAD